MEITKEFLQGQIVGMTRELGDLLEQANLVRGAINACKMLIERLEAPEPKAPPQPLKAVFDGVDVEGLARGSPMDVEGNVDE